MDQVAKAQSKQGSAEKSKPNGAGKNADAPQKFHLKATSESSQIPHGERRRETLKITVNTGSFTVWQIRRIGEIKMKGRITACLGTFRCMALTLTPLIYSRIKESVRWGRVTLLIQAWPRFWMEVVLLSSSGE